MEVHLPIKPKAPGEQGKITVSQLQALSRAVLTKIGTVFEAVHNTFNIKWRRLSGVLWL